MEVSDWLCEEVNPFPLSTLIVCMYIECGHAGFCSNWLRTGLAWIGLCGSFSFAL